MKIPALLRRSRSVATIFCSILAFSPQKKKKKRSLRWHRHFILPFGVVLQKKKGHPSERSTNILVFYWLHAVNNGVMPRSAATYRFLRETISLVFGGRKNAGLCKISARKCRKNFCTFLHLKGTLAANAILSPKFFGGHFPRNPPIWGRDTPDNGAPKISFFDCSS